MLCARADALSVHNSIASATVWDGFDKGLEPDAGAIIFDEPISKSLEEDDKASELREAEEVLRIKLPAGKDAALPLNPSEEPFD